MSQPATKALLAVLRAAEVAGMDRRLLRAASEEMLDLIDSREPRRYALRVLGREVAGLRAKKLPRRVICELLGIKPPKFQRAVEAHRAADALLAEASGNRR